MEKLQQKLVILDRPSELIIAHGGNHTLHTNLMNSSSFKGTFGSNSLLPSPGFIIGFFPCWTDFHVLPQSPLGIESLTMKTMNKIKSRSSFSKPGALQLPYLQQEHYRQGFHAVSKYLTHCVSLLSSLDIEMLWQPLLHFCAQLPGVVQFLKKVWGNRNSSFCCYTLDGFQTLRVGILWVRKMLDSAILWSARVALLRMRRRALFPWSVGVPFLWAVSGGIRINGLACWG